MNERILVVDDEKDICDILQFNLENEGYTADVAYSAEEALSVLSDEHSLILLDVMMGGMSGFKMAEHVRKTDNLIPIIFLTAKNTENDLLTGFSLGGDDYMAKPFSVKELLARVKAILKRNAALSAGPNSRWVYGELVIDSALSKVMLKGVEIALTRKEFEILILLAQHTPNVLTRSEILNRVWNRNEYVLDRTVDVHITRLRKKLDDYASVISNRSGFGYYLDFDSKKES